METTIPLIDPLEKQSRISYSSFKQSSWMVSWFCNTHFVFHDYEGFNLSKHSHIYSKLLYLEALVYEIDDILEDEISLKKEELVSTKYMSLVNSYASFLLKFNIKFDDKLNETRNDAINVSKYEKLLCKFCVLQNNNNNNNNKYEDIESMMYKYLYHRSCDIRALHYVTYQLMNKPYNEVHMEFIKYYNILFEIKNNFRDYYEDIITGQLNIFRCFVGLFRDKAKDEIRKYIKSINERIQQMISDGKIEVKLVNKFEKLVKTQNYEWAKSNLKQTLSWNTIIIPEPIFDETKYKKNHKPIKALL